MINNRLSGRIILITGAGRGAGRKIALALAAHGAFVAANDLTPINLDPVVDEIQSEGGRAQAYIHDIAKKVDVQVMVNNIVSEHGRIDVLINCANVQLGTPLLDIDEWDLHRIFEVNTIGTLLVTQSAGRVMRTQGSGLIINIVKIPPNAPVSFIASRAGLLAVTERLADEWRGYGIRVAAVSGEEPVSEVLAACEGGMLV